MSVKLYRIRHKVTGKWLYLKMGIQPSWNVSPIHANVFVEGDFKIRRAKNLLKDEGEYEMVEYKPRSRKAW